MPPRFFFVIDVSATAVASGSLPIVCQVSTHHLLNSCEVHGPLPLLPLHRIRMSLEASPTWSLHCCTEAARVMREGSQSVS